MHGPIHSDDGRINQTAGAEYHFVEYECRFAEVEGEWRTLLSAFYVQGLDSAAAINDL